MIFFKPKILVDQEITDFIRARAGTSGIQGTYPCVPSRNLARASRLSGNESNDEGLERITYNLLG
jgi:hypothetical protein